MKDDIVKLMSEKPGVAQLIYDNYASMCVSKANALLGGILSKYQHEGYLDFNHKETGFMVTVDLGGKSSIRIFVGFDGTGLSGFFVGVSKDFRGPRADVFDRQTLEGWKTAILDLPNGRGKDFRSNDCWPMWKFIALPDEIGSTTWNGQFFEKVEKDENMKMALVDAIGQAIEDIKEIAAKFG